MSIHMFIKRIKKTPLVTKLQPIKDFSPNGLSDCFYS